MTGERGDPMMKDRGEVIKTKKGKSPLRNRTTDLSDEGRLAVIALEARLIPVTTPLVHIT